MAGKALFVGAGMRGRVARGISAIGRLAYAATGKAWVGRAVALTFDDGPHPEFTPAIVDALTALRIPATFFVVGTLAEERPDLIRLLQERGMAIGLHGYRHYLPRHVPSLPTDWLEREIDDGLAALEKLGVRPRLFRPPMGKMLPRAVRHAQERGLVMLRWHVNPRDWEPAATGEGVAARVLGSARPGSIVVLHDGGGHSRTATREALPIIARGWRRARLVPARLRA